MYRYFILLGAFFLNILPCLSQCAMCRVVAESSQEAGDSIADGLNTGILYLMMYPYILVLVGLISLYFNKKHTS